MVAYATPFFALHGFWFGVLGWLDDSPLTVSLGRFNLLAETNDITHRVSPRFRRHLHACRICFDMGRSLQVNT